MKPGRRPLSRDPLFAAITRLPRAGKHLKYVSARSLALELGLHRNTVNSMIRDLEDAGRIRLVRSRGKRGTLVQILDLDH